MNILSQFNPRNKLVLIDGQEWDFFCEVQNLLELEHSIIVCFPWNEFWKNTPEGIYRGCNIWCYDKATRGVKWIVEEPPNCIRGFSTLFPDMSIDECYMNVSYNENQDLLSAATSGARRFQIDPENGKVTLIATGIR